MSETENLGGNEIKITVTEVHTNGEKHDDGAPNGEKHDDKDDTASDGVVNGGGVNNGECVNGDGVNGGGVNGDNVDGGAPNGGKDPFQKDLKKMLLNRSGLVRNKSDGIVHETSIVARKPKKYHFELDQSPRSDNCDDDVPVLDRLPIFHDSEYSTDEEEEEQSGNGEDASVNGSTAGGSDMLLSPTTSVLSSESDFLASPPLGGGERKKKKKKRRRKMSSQRKLEKSWKDSIRKRNKHLESSTMGDHLTHSLSLHITQEGFLRIREMEKDYVIQNYFLLDRIPINRYARYRDPLLANEPMYSVGCIFQFVTLNHREQFISLAEADKRKEKITVYRFEREFSEAVKSTISLEHAKVVEVPFDASQPRDFEFIIKTPKGEISLIAESEETRQKWISSVQESIVFDEEGERLFEEEQKRLKEEEERRLKEIQEKEALTKAEAEKRLREQWEKERKEREIQLEQERIEEEQRRAEEEERERERLEEEEKERERLEKQRLEEERLEKERQEKEREEEEQREKERLEEEQRAEECLRVERLKLAEEMEKKTSEEFQQQRLARRKKSYEMRQENEKELKEFIEEFSEQENAFLKHSYNLKSKAHIRKIVLMLDKKGNIESICWSKQKKNATIKTIPFGHVHSVVSGTRTSTLRRHKDKRGYPSSEKNCFSIISKQRTLDLQILSDQKNGKEFRDRWVKCLNYALDKFRRVNQPAVLNNHYVKQFISSDEEDDFAIG